eukprot:TRINITY_DN13463_c0_g1_i9.p1 TRINITY_DN13463_c0_g1~~TRINITY_DN13463_c0_g1_i9.p1  ORF type:complete len:492 (-),score=85.06 TRINITY_DN13463_c0_g1_i9:599-2074(-)
MELFSLNSKDFFKEVSKRCPYYVFPVLLWLPKYNWRQNFISDVITGIGVACMLIPQALAYALLAGVPPIVGLYTAFVPLIIFALLTTSRHVCIGPDALVSLLVGNAMSNRVDDAQILASVLAMICGLSLILFGVLRLGFLDNVLSRPLLSGFVNAVAVIIIIEQLNPFLGLEEPKERLEYSWQKLRYTFGHITSSDQLTASIGVLSLGILFGLRILKYYMAGVFPFLKYFVGPLIIVVIGVILSHTLELSKTDVKLLGHYNSSPPNPRPPNLKNVDPSSFVQVVVICIVGFVESIVAVKIYATKHNYPISPNRELVAMGVANLAGSFFQTYPTFVSLTRSSMADYLGACSQIYQLVTSLLVLVAILHGEVIFQMLPLVCMASIIITAAFSLFESHDLVFLWKIRAYRDMCLFFFTFFTTVLLGVDLGIFVGIGISLLMVVRQTTLPHISILGKDEEEDNWVDVYQNKGARIIPNRGKSVLWKHQSTQRHVH